MKIQLQSLKIHNFKGVRDFTLVPDGANVSVSGKNGTGKSTLFDAFTWLLFGKDSHGAAKFQVKPRDSAGEEIIGLEPLVIGELLVDGKLLTLQRELRENWIQHRGSLDKERKSDTTKLLIDGVPKKVAEYQSAISVLVPEDVFKLLTVPGAFNQLNTNEQREMLMSMFGEVSDQDVIAADESLANVAAILDGQTVDDRKKAIGYQKAELKKRIAGIPARIDEAERAKEVPGAPRQQLQQIAVEYQKQVDLLDKKLEQAKLENTDTVRLQRLADLKVELTNERQKYTAGVNLELNGLRDDLNTAQFECSEQQRKVNALEDDIRQLKLQIGRATKEREDTRTAYHKRKTETFEEHATTCPTCGQELPSERVAELRAKFNSAKSNDLEYLVETGKAWNAKVIELEAAYNEKVSEFSAATKDVKNKSGQRDRLKAEYSSRQEELGQFEDTEVYKKLQNQLDVLNATPDTEISNVGQIESDLQKQRDGVKRTEVELQKYERNAKQDERIEELKHEEAELKTSAQKLDGEEFLLQQFTRAKSRLIETKLNAMFKVVKFQLFDVQKNGAIADVVKTTVNGVDYAAGLNTGARLRAGLDIINALGHKLQLTAPIFIDNAEGLTEDFETEAQQIKLYVTQDEKLKVEG